MALAAIFLVAPMGSPTIALDRLDFQVTGADKDLEKTIRAASLLLTQQDDKQTEVEDLFTAARSDYGRILAALYAAGHYSAVIRITIDGREAASIPPLDAPGRIGTIAVSVDPGPRFQFSKTRIAPLARGTVLPMGFGAGQTAGAGVIESAVSASILGWREQGNAKAKVVRDDVLADHAKQQVAADITLDPGPVLRFGPVSVKGAERMDIRRILKIAGLREGEQFSQTELDRAENRLRRSGVFSSVTLSEGETILNGGLLPIGLQVAEQKTRRYSLGAEFATEDGLSLTGYWMHRNLLGGAERLKIYSSVTNLGGGESGEDYVLGVTLDRPATLTADTTASLMAEIGHTDEVDYDLDYAEFGLSFTQYMTEQLTLRGGLSFSYQQGQDPRGDFQYKNLALPLGVTWDRRDSTADARKGFYIDGNLKPFYGFGTTGSGAKITVDARGYRSFGAKSGVTLALRLQGGVILGSDLLETPRDDLFLSGGGGTVRGQPYRSLGIPLSRDTSGTFTIGGTEMFVGSAEVRARVTDSIGLVGFYDYGAIGADGISLSDNFQSGAGLGLRYETGFGPIRLDVATPVGGDTGDGVQIYIGLGQSF